MEFYRWWENSPTSEPYWLEVTDRPDLGTDLHAPQLRDDGNEYFGYSLITEIRGDDLIFHYHKDAKAIVLMSRASGNVWDAEIVWASHTSLPGTQPYARPGWRRGLLGSQQVKPAVTLEQLRLEQGRIEHLREDLITKFGTPLYFPFELSQRRPLRPTQAYLTKFPAAIVNLFPSLRELTQTPRPNQINEIRPRKYMPEYDIGTTYRRADEMLAISKMNPVEIDPALVERGTQGHAKTQNILADYLTDKGIIPRSPLPSEPNYDLAWLNGGILYIAEVKSLTASNEETQLRIGLGQILRYKHQSAWGTISTKGVIIVEREPSDTSWLDVCQAVDVLLTWPERLRSRGIE